MPVIYLNQSQPLIDPKTGIANFNYQKYQQQVIDALKNVLLGLVPIPNAIIVTDAGSTPSFSTVLPGLDASALLDLNASALTSGTVPQGRKWTEASSSATGTTDDVDFSHADLFRCTNASLRTITGFLAGTPGQELEVGAFGGGPVKFADQTGSTAANQIITGVGGPMLFGPTIGRARLVYDGTTARWRLLAAYPLGPVSSSLTTITVADTPYTALTSDQMVLCDASGGVITVKLPAPAAQVKGRQITVKKIDTSGNAVTVDGNGVNIDGGATASLPAAYNVLTAQTDQSQWWTR